MRQAVFEAFRTNARTPLHPKFGEKPSRNLALGLFRELCSWAVLRRADGVTTSRRPAP